MDREASASDTEPLHQFMNDARANLEAAGSLLPVLLVEGDERVLVGIQEMPPTADQRRQLFFALGQRLASLRLKKATLVIDAYMKIDEKGLELPLRRSLSDDPGATECIVVASLDSLGRSNVLLCPYERRPSLDQLEIEFGSVRQLAEGTELYLLQALFDGAHQT